MEKKKGFKLGLVPKLIIAIILGILIGSFMPEAICRIVVTASSLFSTFLKFVIPLMILAYVTMGIADLSQGAGKLLIITVLLAYGSTLIAGTSSYLVSSTLFPSFMNASALEQIAATADASLASYISISLSPILDTLSAVALAFVLGTQSSAATIPVNLQCAEADGICEQIRNFTVPLCANIHMAGSMITITACATAVCLMNQLPISLGTVVPFIMTLGVAMVASPGAPGGSIMTALPFLYMIFGAEAGDPNGPICAIMVALYITQDSFGTACNVSGDNAIGVIVDSIYNRFIAK